MVFWYIFNQISNWKKSALVKVRLWGPTRVQAITETYIMLAEEAYTQVVRYAPFSIFLESSGFCVTFDATAVSQPPRTVCLLCAVNCILRHNSFHPFDSKALKIIEYAPSVRRNKTHSAFHL